MDIDLSTTSDEDNEAMDIIAEVFEEACRTADEERTAGVTIGGLIASPSEYVDYKRLWERVCTVIKVNV